jgi:hypothetical protein
VFHVKGWKRLKNDNKTSIRGLLFLFASFSLFVYWDWELGMCESVRTRNTLHIVVARKSSICYDAVVRRKDEEKRK